MPHAGRTVRVEFSKEHDSFLVKYLATYCPSRHGRSGQKIFQSLVDNEQKQWPWSVHHTWQSWRERYVRNSAHFDTLILSYQRKHGIRSAEKRKRAVEPLPIEKLRPSVKCVKLEEEEDSSSETRAAVQHDNASRSKSKSTPKSSPERHHDPPETPSQTAHPMRKPESMIARPTPPVASPPRSGASFSANVTKKPAPDSTAGQTSHATIEILSSPERQALPLPNGIPEPRSPPRHVKRVKVSLRTPPDIFASEASTPERDAAPSAPGAGAEGASVAPRAPPRVVNSFRGQVLVDRGGHVPRALHHGEKDKEEEEEEEEKEEKEDKSQWPPARGRTAKRRRTSGPDVEVDKHHAFSQPQSLPWPEVPRESEEIGEREHGKPYPPFERVPWALDESLLDRRTVAARFSGQVYRGAAPQVEGERRERVAQDGASPVEPIVTTAPPSDPFSGQISKPPSKVLKFPAPRASTRSPFRPEPPAEGTRHPPSPPQPRQSLRMKVARHPALTRIRRQTIGHGHEDRNRNENGHEHEHRREVPSVDLVALSHSSMSARSHSRSSADVSVPARPARWSLPAFAHATPWVFDETQGYSDFWSGRAGISTPRLMLTSSPARSIASANTVSAPHANGVPTPPSVSLTPHPPDLRLTASHGLASILAHMSANHGLALSVVEAVYERVGNLREADEVLKGMREAAEGFGEREIERRMRVRRGGMGRGGRNGRQDRGEGSGGRNGRAQLRYVVASEDGEGSEYSPPETSRAAMWKRQSESASYVEEEEEEEEAEGRAVEQELLERDEHEDEEGMHHDFSQHAPLAEGDDKVTAQDEDAQGAESPKWEEPNVTEVLLEDNRLAQELERKLGKGRYRRDIVKLFR